jgi:intracellular sulfur oxidation DsrE/DsrF family protein
MKNILLALFVLFGLAGTALADNAAVSERVVVQANGISSADFRRALTLAINMHEALNKAKFEVIVYGESVKYLTAFSDEIPLVQKAQSAGIDIVACGRSLGTENVSENDMAPGVKVVPFGAVRIVNLQKQGWQYIKP